MFTNEKIKDFNLERFDIQEYNLQKAAQRKKLFDRKTFNPTKNPTDKSILSSLRRHGKSRFGDLQQFLRREINPYDYSFLLKSTPCLNWCHSISKGVFIDAGCGESPDTDIWLLKGGAESYALDLFPRIEQVEWEETERLKAFTYKRSSKFIQQDICEQWPFKKCSVDGIGCYAVLDLLSLEERLKFYRESYRVLKPNGRIVCEIFSLANGHGFDNKIELENLKNVGFDVSRSCYGILCGEK